MRKSKCIFDSIINRAFDTLINEKTKYAYDVYCNETREIIIDQSGKIISPIKSAKDSIDLFWDKTIEEKEKFKNNTFDEFERLFGFDKLKQENSHKNKGEDIDLDIDIKLEDLIQQEKKKILFKKKVHCLQCKGTKIQHSGNQAGIAQYISKYAQICFECHGIGKRITNGDMKSSMKCEKCKGLSYLGVNECPYNSDK